MSIRVRILAASALTALIGMSAPSASAQAGPRFESLTELAEILGEAHAIRTLCNGLTDETWRDYMMRLMNLEAPSGPRKSSLTSAFNRGYRIQSSQHSTCTSAMIKIEGEIAARGRALSDAIALSYLE